jgi:ribose/xylose/arabinose/galactoside ABC-type transport system permease subunit
LNIGVRQPCSGSAGADRLEPDQLSRIRGFPMAALIAIGLFIVAIFVLNLIEFGRLD